ncbi:MAG: pyroglutamyl-peptidase I, partial [Pseudorhodoplanes sp.]|nr:pyroglutamyl-peptidase I [Pseudorhodoplanes sp.]
MARPRCILVTGFGPFPGAPSNPTMALVRHLARLRRPALSDVRLVGHIFPTSYAAVDRELPALIRQHCPDAVVMFGLAARTRLRPILPSSSSVTSWLAASWSSIQILAPAPPSLRRKT